MHTDASWCMGPTEVGVTGMYVGMYVSGCRYMSVCLCMGGNVCICVEVVAHV